MKMASATTAPEPFAPPSSPSPAPGPEPVAPEALHSPCDPAELGFETTETLPEPEEGLGHARAVEALRLALAVEAPGYHVFVLGEPGSSRHTVVRGLLQAHANGRPAPPDWVYLNNFGDPNRPRALSLPAGEGTRLRAAMQHFVGELGRALATAFEGDEYRSRLEAIQAETKQREESGLQALGAQAAEQGVALLRTPQGFAFAPTKEGEPLAAEAFEALSEGERERLTKVIESLRGKLQQLLHELPRLRRQMQLKLREATRETMGLAAGHLIDELRERFAHLPPVLDFLGEVLQDILEAGEQLRDQPRDEEDDSVAGLSGSLVLHRYQVNLLVGREPAGHAPVLRCDHPTVANLIGRVDHTAHLGTLLTNFTLVRPGALHRANGGCLMLDAMKVLAEPWAWASLKRALKSGEVRIESLPQMLGWVHALPLEPEPIPLQLKIVMIGEREVHDLLQTLDPEFNELFKVAADFDDDLPRDPARTRELACLLGSLGRARGLRPLHREAVARVVEHAARLADDARRLSTRTRALAEVLQEADAWAAQAGRQVVGREDVVQAIQARERRGARLRERLHEALLRDTLLVSTSGSHVGQVNGLVVAEVAGQRFAYPVRVTATARLGDGELLDIERESTLGGPIHSKGVMILAAFLGARYAQDLPLSLSASLVFEQSYGPVEGDSASLAELCALLSTLAVLPVRQGVAVTGSINQFGLVQAVGGVNEKVEGFFELCRARGLDGTQGVIVPRANLQHLMLREEVVQAAAAGRFHVWAVSDVDEAIALLTGVPAGLPNAKGEVPVGSVNHRVAVQLTQLSLVRQAWEPVSAGRPRRAARPRSRPRPAPRRG